jgi:hypothetical protein
MQLKKAAQILGVAVAFGVVVAIVKGQDTGVRDALGNTSAPWVLVPFFAGTRCTTLSRAAVAGVVATLAAFLGFYVAEAAILDLGPHPWYVDLQLTLRSGNVYERWGIFSGLAYGALGWLWVSRRSALAAAAVGIAFVAEPLIVLALDHARIWAGGELYFQYPWMWIGELLVGLAAIAWALAARERGRAPRTG